MSPQERKLAEKWLVEFGRQPTLEKKQWQKAKKM